MRIGELANATGTTTKTLRFYESEGLMPLPPRTSSGYRDYPSNTVHRIAFIRRGQSAGLKLAQIGEILHIRDGGNAPCAHVQSLLSGRLKELDDQIADLLVLRETVGSLHSASLTVEPAACAPNQVCQYI
ncbi:heavy metal-responsive transcriptional regulator [Arthrobacter roseus]|uniref:heavy metal-responsive transcriptional regulator n=1 Tax=Arthrobacter roseus TaxID=136274 RepID=UPI001962E0FB|nr:heavy metal-responsive transcriptional regulator [Arthrobacter roseus]MBM7846792.1 DNA-binding transcriptional MerR regulator [Arthrobacter roseus]